MCDLPVYICTGCDHSIPTSVVEHKAILSGLMSWRIASLSAISITPSCRSTE